MTASDTTPAQAPEDRGAAEDGIVPSRTGTFNQFHSRPAAVAATAVLLVLAGCAAFAPLIAPHGPNGIDLLHPYAPPSGAHWFGTDAFGRDFFARCLYGGRISLLVGVATMLIAVALGSIVGLTAATAGGIADAILMRLVDIVLALPSFFMLIIAATLFPPSVGEIILVLALLSWMTTARLVRGEILSLREREFVQAARALGVGTGGLIRRHLLPNVVGTVSLQATLTMASAILAESGLSYLGLGISQPTASWGSLLSDGQQYLQIAPWLVYPPGALIALTILSVYTLGTAIRAIADPYK